MTRPWPEQVVDAALSGEPARLPGERLDDLLAWLLDRDQPGTRLLSEQFEGQGVRREQAVQLSLALLDELLSRRERNPLECLGFTEQPDQDTLRRRYRRLQQVFHPDRQFGGEAWATQRSEAINSAYRMIKSGRLSAPEPVVATPPAEPTAATDMGGGNNYGYPRRRFADRMRVRLGSSSKVQRAVVSSLVLVSVTGLALTYLAYRSDTQPAAGALDGSPGTVLTDRTTALSNGEGATSPEAPAALQQGAVGDDGKVNSAPGSHSKQSLPDVQTTAAVAWGTVAVESAPAERWRETRAADPPDAALFATEFTLPPPRPSAAGDRPGPLMQAEGRQARWQARRRGMQPDVPAGSAATSAAGRDPQLAEGARPDNKPRLAEPAGESGDSEPSRAADPPGGDTAKFGQSDAAAAGEDPELSAVADAGGAAARRATEPPAVEASASGASPSGAGKPASPQVVAGSSPEQGVSDVDAEPGAVAAANGEGAAPPSQEPAPDPAQARAADARAANRTSRSAAAREADGVATARQAPAVPGNTVAAAPATGDNAYDAGATDPCRGYRSFLRRYEDAYDRGQLEHLLDLYASDARENQLDGLPAIAATYRQFFGDTRSRRITIAVAGVEAGEDECRLDGDYRVTYSTGSGRRRESAGTIVLHLVDADAGFRIAEIRY